MGWTLEGDCPRKRDDCDPLDIIKSSEDKSFFCCGFNNGQMSEIKEDRFTVCFKGEFDDNISCVDKRDLIHDVSVKCKALAIIEEMDL